MTNRANAICVLQILNEYSDSEHILGMKKIMAKLKSLYNQNMDRRTIYAAVELLTQLGYDISTYEENGKGYFLRTRDFETAEVRLLMDAVYAHQAISARQTQKLIAKLQNLLNNYQRKAYKNLTVVRSSRKTINLEVFLNIEILDEAIRKQVKVQFTYLQYGLDKKLHPRREKKYTVNPYQLIYTNEHYYLLCRLAYQEQLSLYRLDLMQNIQLTDYVLDKELTQAELQAVENNTVYAWYALPETVEMRCRNHIIGDVLDKFGTDVHIMPQDNDFFTVRLQTTAVGLKFWALQYLPYVEVLWPTWLRQEILDSVKQNPYLDIKVFE